jgi:hypothetical protein
MSLFQEIVTEVETFKAEYEKFDRGNKIAGTRARVSLQKIKTLAHSLRAEIQARKTEGAAGQA